VIAPVGKQRVADIDENEVSDALALMLTRRCNMTCAHCSVQSGPKIRTEPADAEILDFLRSAIDAGVTWLQITGGEPMMREKLVFDIIRMSKRRSVVTTMSSNGFWGRKPASAWRKVGQLKRLGLSRLTISYDRYHAEFQGAEPALNIARAAEWFDLPVSINVTRVANDPELAAIVQPFETKPQLRMRFYDVQTIGRARELPKAELRAETSGFCSACNVPALTDDGRMTACNGPPYFEDPASPLVIGSVHETPIEELLSKHASDPILETIRRWGPERLLSELNECGGAEKFGIRPTHAGICDLCIDINSKPEAVAVLRERLSAEKHRAELLARRIVIERVSSAGPLSIEYVNGRGVGRLWAAAGRGDMEAFNDAAERVLGRADFDWKKQSEYITRCSLARPLANAFASPALRRWAPTFFVEKMHAAAVNESLVDLAQREIIRLLGDALKEIGANGILLKGAAFLAIDAFGESNGRATRGFPRRGSGDIDLYVGQADASLLRSHLLETGFSGAMNGNRTGPHHMAPVSCRGVSVEIHTQIMPDAWGLPERDLVGAAVPLKHIPSLSTLDPEGMLLHSIVHSTAHLFSHGIRAAWDAQWITDRFPAISGERMLRLVRRCAMPRSFWVPARVIHRDIVKLPVVLMVAAPSDEKQRRLERVAEVRMFTALEDAFELNPISKNGLFLMLHDSLGGRSRHLVSLLGREERGSRKAAAELARARSPKSGSGAFAVQLNEGLAQWRAFRRAITR